MSSPPPALRSLASAFASKRGIYSLVLGTTLGSTIWHTFISGPVAYQTLPRMQFGNLQAHLFPVFFSIQSGASIALYALWTRGFSNVRGPGKILNKWLLGTMIATAVANGAVVGPWTTTVMNRRHRLERAEGRSYYDTVKSEDMKRLNKLFAWAHGLSSLLNLGYVVACVSHTVWIGQYGYISA